MTFLQAISESIPEYRMYRSGSNQGGVGTSYNLVTNMVAADPAYEIDIISNAIVIPYNTDPYTAVVYAQIVWTGGIQPSVGCRIRRSGSDLVTGALQTNSANNATATTTVTVSGGDSFELYFRGEGNFFMRPSLVAGVNTYLRVTPVGN